MSDVSRLWPLQRDCNTFYGRPVLGNGRPDPQFEIKNIVRVNVPFSIFYGPHHKTSVRAHRKCAEVLGEWFEQVWKNAGRSQRTINEWGMSTFNGDFLVRQKRVGSSLSMHSYGCAWDFDAANNGFGDKTPRFARADIMAGVIVPFEKLGGIWGGRWKTNCDGMHFQFARPG